MPWTAEDAEEFTSKADTPEKRRQWADVANDTLARCLDDGGERDACEASAIRQANGVIAKAEESAMGTVAGSLVIPVGEGVSLTVAELVDFYTQHAEAEVYKTVDGERYPASDFLVVEDAEKPTTWHLQVRRNGKPDHRLMAAARAALTSPGGHRGNRYEGPDKAAALKRLKALYADEEMDWGESEAAEQYADAPTALPGMVDTLATSFADLYAAREANERAARLHTLVYEFQELVGNVMLSPDLADKAAALRGLTEEFIALLGDETQAEPEAESEGEPTEPGEASFAEAAAVEGWEVLAEDGAPLAEAADLPPERAPVVVRFQMIRPGPGNRRDRHFYPADVLRRDARVFEGVDVFTTDHNDQERSEKTKVGRVRRIAGFTDDGAPVAEVVLYDPALAEKTRARASAGELATMECSIRASGVARVGKVGDDEYNIVEQITKGHFLDLVSKAGAGGKALALAESDAQTEGGEVMENQEAVVVEVAPDGSGQQPAQIQEDAGESEAPVAASEAAAEQTSPAAPVALAEADVTAALESSRLPAAAREKLAGRQYASLDELGDAIKAEVDYLKEVTGSGQPIANGGGAVPQKRGLAERDETMNAVAARMFNVRRPAQNEGGNK